MPERVAQHDGFDLIVDGVYGADAMAGVDRMFFNMSVSPDYLTATSIVCAVALEAAPVEVIVNMSQMTVSQMTLTSTSESKQHRLHWLAEHIIKDQEREIARLMEFVHRFRAKNTKATQAQSKLRQIDRMEKIEAPSGPDSRIDFQFPQPQRSGQKVITLEGIHHAYGSNVVYRGMNFQAERGQRMVLVGPNGAGKSTLLKILAGVLEPQAGRRLIERQRLAEQILSRVVQHFAFGALVDRDAAEHELGV